MLYIFPDYYPKFSCIAGDCEETCCSGWQIVADRQSLKKYASYKGPYRRRLLFSVNWSQGTFRQDGERRCAHLDDNNLCRLYQECGADYLCRTCRLFPRHVESFDNIREISLSLGCPEASRIILNNPNHVSLCEFEREDQEEEDEDFDMLFYDKLCDARAVMMDAASSDDLTLREKLTFITALASDLQNRYDRREIFSFDEVLDRANAPKGTAKVRRIADENKSAADRWTQECLKAYRGLEFLHDDWASWLVEMDELLGSNANEYRIQDEEFEKWMCRDERDWGRTFEHILSYYLYVYFCGCVYDGGIRKAAVYCVQSTWMIREMCKALWVRNEYTLDGTDLVDMTVRISRETEHSDPNRKKLENWGDKHLWPIF